MRFLAIGECMAEMAPTGQDDTYRLGFAGDTLNTAWYLARCAPDFAVSFLTVVGNDTISEQMIAFLRESRINTRHVKIDDDRTVGLYLVSLENGERSFSYWRGQSAAKKLAKDRTSLDAAMASADVIYFSGITLAILPPEDRSILLAALKAARASGRTVAFDPNLRPRLWASPSEMTKEIMRGAGVSDIVLPSFEDETNWFSDADPKATADRYQKAGAITVIVKNGADAVLFAEGSSHGTVQVIPVDAVVDTTAAGDSFNAGIFARHAAGDTLSNGIAYACALSRLVVQARGALVPLNPADVRPTP